MDVETASSEYQTETGRLNASSALYESAQSLLPGGTTRITVEKYPIPIYVDRGEGAWLIDVDGNRYLDLGNNFTTLIHGHAFAPVADAINTQVRRGSSFSNPTPHELELATVLRERVPGIDQLRFVNTGTEAVMFAIKAARALTGRYRIAKFEGAYHGAYDWAEVSQSSAPCNWGNGTPSSVPVARATPPSVLQEVVVLPANDIETTVTLFERHGQSLACILVDLMSSRPGLIPFDPEFLAVLRTLADRYGVLIIDDEVLNFRLSYHGAATRFDFRPDLITLGKIIGGGLPIGAIGGAAELMQVFDSSEGPPDLPQGGTFSANPLSMVAGVASLGALDKAAFAHLEVLGERVRYGLREVIRAQRAGFCITGLGSLFRIHPKPKSPETYREAYQCAEERALMRSVAARMLSKGVIIPAFAAASLSTPMSTDDIDFVVECFDQVLGELASSGEPLFVST